MNIKIVMHKVKLKYVLIFLVIFAVALICAVIHFSQSKWYSSWGTRGSFGDGLSMDGGIIKTECDKEDRIVYAYEVWMGEVYLEVKDEEGNTYYEHCMKETAGEVAKYEGCITFSNEQPQVFYVHSYVISEEAVVGGHIQGEEMCNNFDVFIRKLRLYLLGF